MVLSGADCDLRLHASMDRPSNATGYVERVGDDGLADVNGQMGIVCNGWNE